MNLHGCLQKLTLLYCEEEKTLYGQNMVKRNYTLTPVALNFIPCLEPALRQLEN